MQSPLQNKDTFGFDEFTTFSERVKKTTQETVNKMETRLNFKIDDKITTKVISLDDKYASLDNKVYSLDSKVASLD